MKTLAAAMSAVDGDAPQTPKIPKQNARDQPLCYEFITTGVGCKRGDRCNFFHADIEKQETKDLPPGILRTLQRALQHPQISPHFKGTTRFVDYLAELGGN